ncbi:MAG: PDZ domain-containing protein [Bacteroidota bacterium]
MNYRFFYSNPATKYIDIEFLVAVSTEIITVKLPAWRPGRYELGNFAKNIQKWQAFNEKGDVLSFEKTNKDTWAVNTKNAKQLIIKYNYYAAELNAGSTWLDNEQIYVNPVNCCLYVPESMDEACEVELLIPEDYKIACSLPKNGNKLTAKNFDELADSPFVASNTLQREYFVIDGIEFNLWFVGKCKPNWGKLINDFFIFCNEQLALFGKFPSDEYHFIFQIVPYPHYHGVEHVKSTVVALGPSYKLMEKEIYDELLGVSCHELFHVWNIKTIRPKEMMPYDFSKENYSRLGFIAEGVTTYYGDFLLYRSGVFNEQDYFGTFNDQLKKHFDNAGRTNYSVAASSFDTWLDGYQPGVPGRKVSIYTEGCLLAFATDILIRKQTQNTKCLDDVMRYLNNEFACKGIGYSESDYKLIIENLTQQNWDEFFINYVYGTHNYETLLKDCLNYIGLQFKITSNKKYNEDKFGFKTIDEGGITRVAAVYPNSPAEKAGLQINDKIVAVNNMEITANLNEWLTYFAANSNSFIVSRNKEIKQIEITADGKNYYQSYTVQRIANALAEQMANYKMWCKRDF